MEGSLSSSLDREPFRGCLNPCSNGRLSELEGHHDPRRGQSLNPCSNGRLSEDNNNIMTVQELRLNPCSNGRLSEMEFVPKTLAEHIVSKSLF